MPEKNWLTLQPVAFNKKENLMSNRHRALQLILITTAKEEIMIKIIATKDANTLTDIMPKKNFEAIKPQLDELVNKAQIELTYRPTDKDPNRIYIKCLTTDTVKPSVEDLLYS